MVQAVRRFLRRDRDYFAYHQSEVKAQNALVLRLTCVVWLAVLAVYTVLALLSGESRLLVVLHLVFGLMQLALCAYVCFRPRRRPLTERGIVVSYHLLLLTVLVFFLLVSVFPFPQWHSIFYPFPLILLVTIFSFRARHALALIFSYVAAFALLVCLFKSGRARVNDLYVASGTLLSALAGYAIAASLRHETGNAIGRLHYLSTTDSLTGLCNRQTFEALCQAYMADWRKGAGYALLFLDIDDFKQINDTYGHPVGDRVLKGIGAVLQEAFYEKDYLCRYGGDEFVVFMADAPDEDDVSAQVAQLGERIRLLGAALNLSALSLSVGVAMHAQQRETYSELLARADAALYIAKRDRKRGAANARMDEVKIRAVPIAPAGAPAKAEAPDTGLRRRVLIADDNRMNRILLGEILRLHYDVLEVENGRQAMDALRGNADVAAVLLDLIMPVMDGYAVLAEMRADERLRGIPVIVTTGQTEAEAEMRALALGADDVVLKPYRAAIITRRLENAIRLRATAA